MSEPKKGQFVKGNKEHTKARKTKGIQSTKKFRDLCRKMAHDKVALANVREILMNHEHPQFAKLWVTLNEFAYGKALQTMEVSGTLPELRVLDSE